MCPRTVLAVFGGVFLIALLSVPVTTRTSQVRQDKSSNLVVRTTYPQNANMFLPRYLAAKADPARSGNVQLRSAQWIGTMAIVFILGAFDSLVICRIWGRSRRRRAPGQDDDGEGSHTGSSGLSLFP